MQKPLHIAWNYFEQWCSQLQVVEKSFIAKVVWCHNQQGWQHFLFDITNEETESRARVEGKEAIFSPHFLHSDDRSLWKSDDWSGEFPHFGELMSPSRDVCKQSKYDSACNKQDPKTDGWSNVTIQTCAIYYISNARPKTPIFVSFQNNTSRVDVKISYALSSW